MSIRTILNETMEAALNKQGNAELWSAYLYLSMSYDMKQKGFEGMGNWFAVQAKEEFAHATRIFEYIEERNGTVKLFPIEEVRQEWLSPKEAFEDTLIHEKLVTEMIHNLMDKAIELKDYATQGFLQWFVNEQVEEEDAPRKYLAALEKAGDDAAALYMLDKGLGKRKED
ncbi:MAG: ferritin [Bacteroidales bacterium]|nr:ferritin [Bacteroidales bacterium]